jgi:hypothetical protein
MIGINPAVTGKYIQVVGVNVMALVEKVLGPCAAVYVIKNTRIRVVVIISYFQKKDGGNPVETLVMIKIRNHVVETKLLKVKVAAANL